MSPRVRVTLAAAFCLSGMAALIYQVAWQRILVLHSGVGVYSVALITAAYMAGLGIGSHWGGAWSVRLEPSRALHAFAGLELAVACFAAASPWLYYDVLYRRAPDLYADVRVAGLLHLAALIVPTTLMGMTLPFLVRAVVRDAAGAGRTVADVYGVNVIGAGLGALLAPWLLIRHLGIAGAIYAGVAANALAAALALSLGGRRETTAPATTPPLARCAGRPSPALSLPSWMLLYALSGFCALSLEIVWFRIMDVGAKSTTFTFGTVLAIYLLGLAAGSLAGGRLVARLRDPLRWFLFFQTGLLLWSGAAIALLAWLPADTPLFDWFFAYWGERRGFRLGRADDLGALLRLYLVWPGLLFGPPTVLMGLSFAALQGAVQDDPRTSGRKAGMLQAANIAGSMTGSLAVGLVLLSALGTTGTVRALVLAGLVFVAVGMRRYGPEPSFALLGASALALAAALPDQNVFWNRLHGRRQADALVGEDAAAVVAFAPGRRNSWSVWMAGRSVSGLPFGGVHTRLGALPALMHAQPRAVAIVGLGSGDTAWAAGCRQETRSLRVFELSGPQASLLEQVSQRPGMRRLRLFLEDPRVQIVIGDGRHGLLHEQAWYDVIEADPLLPEVAGSGNVYSQEFFELIASRLKRGGLACSWGPTPRAVAAFTRALPFVVVSDRLLIGSNQRISLDREAWLERARAGRVVRYFGRRRHAEVVAALERVRPLTRAELPRVEPNRDLYPRDEFAVYTEP